MTARGRVSTGQSDSNQKNRETDVEKISDDVRRRADCGALGFDPGRLTKQKSGVRKVVFFISIPDGNDSQRFTTQAIAAGELDDVIGVGGTGRLGEDRQRPRQAVMLVSGTVSLVMKHQACSVCADAEDGAVVGINRSQQPGSNHSERRERAQIEEQPAPARNEADRRAGF